MKVVRQLAGIAAATVALGDRGDRLAAADSKGKIVVWRTLTDQPTLLREANGTNANLTFSPDSEVLLTQDFLNGELALWDVASARRLWVKAAPRGAGLAFDATGRRLLISPGSSHAGESEQGLAHVWNAETGAELLQLRVSCTDAATFSPDGRTIVTLASCGPTLRLWNAQSGALMAESEPYGFPGKRWRTTRTRHASPSRVLRTARSGSLMRRT